MGTYRCAACGAFNRVPEPPPPGAPVCGRCKGALDTSGKPQSVDAASLARLRASSPVPVLVDFWAAWCGPCRMIAPVLEEIGTAKRGKLLVVKVDTEREPAAAAAYQVRGIPTLALLAGGREVSRQTGALPRPDLERWLSSAGV